MLHIVLMGSTTIIIIIIKLNLVACARIASMCTLFGLVLFSSLQIILEAFQGRHVLLIPH